MAAPPASHTPVITDRQGKGAGASGAGAAGASSPGRVRAGGLGLLITGFTACPGFWTGAVGATGFAGCCPTSC